MEIVSDEFMIFVLIFVRLDDAMLRYIIMNNGIVIIEYIIK